MSTVKKILNRDRWTRGELQWLPCCWDDCDKPAVQLHRLMFHDHNRGTRCGSPGAKHLWYAFCSERHRQMYLNGHRDYGNASTGNRGLIS